MKHASQTSKGRRRAAWAALLVTAGLAASPPALARSVPDSTPGPDEGVRMTAPAAALAATELLEQAVREVVRTRPLRGDPPAKARDTVLRDLRPIDRVAPERIDWTD